MNMYKVTIYDHFFEMELTGEFEAAHSWEAEETAREVYANELGTSPEEIDVVDVAQVEIAEKTEKAGAPTTAHPQAKNNTPHHEKGQVQSIAQPAAAVNLAEVYTTPSVYDEMGRNAWFRYDLHAAVGRFSAGDWGDMLTQDAEISERAIEASTDKIVGIYDTQAGRVCVMAEPAAAGATILFEAEL